jgi:hypothetical protein
LRGIATVAQVVVNAAVGAGHAENI